ncbi:fumarylacetoacetate hydrolase family protein [Nocardiopsis rhodophaea]|uniref:fumarylacetoacetate hydrolase family protein n=1 Tax=Nocardiopsis rhodophaea TaxID=280238 RepID=UPI0031E11C98
MLICRYSDGGRRGHGRVADDGARVVPVVPDRGRWTSRGGRSRPLTEVTLLPPAEPSKIASVALNYAPDGRTSRAGADHCHVVLKPPSSVACHGDPVSHPGAAWELKHEAELAVVIGARCKRVPAERAADVVAGYTCANDITAYARTPPAGGHPAVWAKHFDGCTPLGPWLATDLDADRADIACTVNGETRQKGNSRNLITPVYEAVAAVSEQMTLLPGDVILTGTPSGSGPLAVGDTVEVSIPGIGTLRNLIGPPGS